eukprot:EG_transcript_22237
MLDYFDVFDCHDTWTWSKETYSFPIICGVVYVLFVFLGPLLMKSCKPVKVKHSLALWNFILSAFSTFGFAVSFPFVLSGLREKGFHYMVCSDEMMFGGHDPNSGAACYGWMGFVMTGFMLSKFPEMFDTAFLVARKRDIIFLHWWHHLTVMLNSYYAYASSNPSSVIFATVNYGIHSVMYFYYGLCVYTRSLGFLRQPITTLQLSQMAVGVFIVAMTRYYQHAHPEGCSPTYVDSYYYLFHFGMYGSYFILFLKFYVENYVLRKSAKAD